MPSFQAEYFNTGEALSARPGCIIKRAPHVGQIVHYWPLQCEKSHDHNQPFRADICHVHDDGRVNLIICNEIGIASRRTHVPLNLDGPAKSGEASMFL
jgi:hypothetical protein